MVNEATTAPSPPLLQPPPPPLPLQLSSDSLYSRKGMDSLKAALLILIVKERLKQRPESSSLAAESGSAADEFGARSKRPRLDNGNKDTLVCDALDQFTGDVHLWKAHSKSNDDIGENEIASPTDSSSQENYHRPFTSLITHGNNHKQWEVHLQHVLLIIWRQPIFGTSSGHGTSDRLRSLCQHVACQLELATLASTATATTASSSAGTATATDHAETTSEKLSDSPAVVVTNWIRTQLTAFLLPTTVVQAAFSHGTTGTATTATASTLSSWWCTIWHHILHSSPLAMSQLLVPLLLELILQYGGEGAAEREGAAATTTAASISATATTVVAPASKSTSKATAMATAPGPKQSATSTAQDAASATSSVVTAVVANSGHDDGNNDNDASYVMVGLDPLQLLSLLEQAMECAPRHVLAAADAMLMQPQQPQQSFDAVATATTTATTGHHGTLTHRHHPSVSLLPTRSTSWFCTQDLAHDMLLLHQSSSTRPINKNNPSAMNEVADFFLLGHGLAALSERLASSGFGISGSKSNPVDVPAMSLPSTCNVKHGHGAYNPLQKTWTED